jgi:hypothetical protein
MRKAVRVVSESLLKRIGDPASSGQSDYQAIETALCTMAI